MQVVYKYTYVCVNLFTLKCKYEQTSKIESYVRHTGTHEKLKHARIRTRTSTHLIQNTLLDISIRASVRASVIITKLMYKTMYGHILII